jgi:hypothetical protein
MQLEVPKQATSVAVMQFPVVWQFPGLMVARFNQVFPPSLVAATLPVSVTARQLSEELQEISLRRGISHATGT